MTRHIACDDATVIGSLDGVGIVVHDFGGAGRPVLLSHATGFHAHCWEPLAARLARSYRVFALDHRGYGDADTVDPATISWRSYGDDALAAARHVASMTDGTPIVGVGHSMGGASLLMAAHREPALFDSLFVFEPIVFPPPDPAAAPRAESPLPAGARRRRSIFPSFEAALENFASKPPLASFHPAAREAYVRHGFKPHPEGIELKCLPEHEARTYETGATSGAWDDLPELSTLTWVVSGALAPFQPSSFARQVAERIPGSTYVQYDEMSHFGPLEDPDAFAELIERTLASRR